MKRPINESHHVQKRIGWPTGGTRFWLHAFLMMLGCSRGEVSTEMVVPHDYARIRDRAIGAELQVTSFLLESCEVLTSATGGGCDTNDRRSTLTPRECGDIKSLLATERLGAYASDDFTNVGGTSMGGSSGSTLHAETLGGSGGSSGVPADLAGGGPLPCGGGDSTGATTGTAEFWMHYYDARGQIYDFTFMFDGRSLTSETSELIAYVRSLHAKYASE